MALKLRYWTFTFLLFVALGVFFERPAHAYTDPGSCLLLFQTVGAVASGVLFYFRRRVKQLFGRQTSKKTISSPAVLSRTDS
ncbi:MAG: hypothetical protein ACRYFU_04860 [Janthinobacterium lividum]